MNHQTRAEPFRLKGELIAGRVPLIGELAETLIERLSGLRELSARYRTLPPANDMDQFLEQVMQIYGLDYLMDDASAIPVTGGAVVVANHPYGGVEGVLLAVALRRIRPDVKVMANHLLQRIPELRPLFIGVDPFGTRAAADRNSAPLREAVRWVRDGGLLVVFPAGAVSHFELRQGQVTDPPWSPTVARLIRLVQATVIPIYVHGQNGLMFQAAGMVHPYLRTFLLAREFANKVNRTIRFTVGRPLPFSRMDACADNDALIASLRARTYALAERIDRRTSEGPSLFRRSEKVADPVPRELLAAEMAILPADQCLERNGDLAVFFAKAAQMPWILQELGRLREVAFRAAGEGTGRSRDIDLFDAYYIHLFVWNHATQEIVGAYRLGLADDIVRKFGKRGLYTYSLFRYSNRLLQEINPAIELGRSFVREEYQRSYAPLLLLWKGIGGFVARHPRYRVLFGPVSISNDYVSASRQLLVRFLRANSYLPQLARLVRPRRPFKMKQPPDLPGVMDLDSLSELLRCIEEDEKGVPVLLRQYLKLGGRLIGFNVDPQFNDALDGLIMVDLDETEPSVLARYMGKEGAAAFLSGH